MRCINPRGAAEGTPAKRTKLTASILDQNHNPNTDGTSFAQEIGSLGIDVLDVRLDKVRKISLTFYEGMVRLCMHPLRSELNKS